MTALPTGWRMVRLGDVADTALGKMLDKSKDSGQVRVPYLRNVNVQWGRVDTSDVLTVELSEAERTRFALRDGDLLVCEGGEVGRAAIWSGTGYMAYQKALHRIRPGSDLDARFLRHFLEHLHLTGHLASVATGSTIKHLPQERLRQLPVPLPPVEEQRRIVDILEDHLSRLDAATEGVQASRARLSALRSSVLTDCLRGAVLAGDETRGLNFGQAILHVPSRWEITTVGSQAELVEYGTGSKTGSLRRDDDIPVLRMGNIKEGRLDWTNMKYLPADHADFPRLLLQPGDLLFNRTNSAEHVGKSAVFAGEVARASAASYLIRVRFRSGVNPAWANMVINSLYGREFVASVVSQQVGQANVNGTKLKRFPLPLPPLAEQDQLVDRYDGATEVIDRQLLALGGVMDRSASLRRSLLAAAFDGRLSAEPIEAFARV